MSELNIFSSSKLLSTKKKLTFSIKRILFIIFLCFNSSSIIYGENAANKEVQGEYQTNKYFKSDRKYKEGILIVTKAYDREGVLCKEIIHGWAGKVGVNRVYYKDGKLREAYYFQNGNLLKHEQFDSNGQMTFVSINQPWGERKDSEYYTNRQLKKETTYQNFRLASIKEYDQAGNLVKQFMRKDIPYD